MNDYYYYYYYYIIIIIIIIIIVKTNLFWSQKLVPAKHKKNHQSAKINSRKFFVPHSNNCSFPKSITALGLFNVIAGMTYN